MTDACPVELRQLYRKGAVLPFIGAGASMDVSWTVDGKRQRGPSWVEMVDQACRMLGYNEPDLLRFRGTDTQILEYFGEKKGNFAPLTNWLVRQLHVDDDALKASRIHNRIARMTECAKFYTTNYDDFLERSIQASGRSVKVIKTERDMGLNGSSVEVIKYHGDFDTPEKMVFSEGHYYSRMRFDDPLDLKLRSDLLGRVALFIGYSFRDINIAYLFDHLNAMYKSHPTSPSGRRGFIIVNNPSDFEYVLFKKRNIEIIPVYGDDKGQGIVDVIESLIS